MKRILATLCALLIASTASAAVAADEYLYLFVSAKGADGGSVRHRLECTDAKCAVEVKDDARTLELSDVQRAELLAAMQAETRQFALGGDAVPKDGWIKLKIRYETPEQRLAIERRFTADAPDAVTPEMRRVLKTYFDLEFSASQAASGDGSSRAPAPGR